TLFNSSELGESHYEKELISGSYNCIMVDSTLLRLEELGERVQSYKIALIYTQVFFDSQISSIIY
ncbi:unnamed protein product, partial [Dovyalis caffra]